MKEYIERADVMPALEDYYEPIDPDQPMTLTLEQIAEVIENMPAADVVEVRHGRWIEDERTYPGPGLKNNLCSVCGEIAGSWKEGLEPGRKWAYCPNCGARMGKEDEHE